TGSLTIAWSSNPARGCAVDGLCGVDGSLEVLPAGGSSSSSYSSAPAPIQAEVSDPNAAVRTITTGPGTTILRTCTDLVPVDLTFTIAHGKAVSTQPFQAPSSGRCAGPTAADLARITLPARPLARRGYDLSGTVTFAAGPFSVTLISTLHDLISTGPGTGLFGGIGTGVAGGPSGAGTPVRTRAVLQETAEYDYRVAALSGTLTTSFAGLPAPLCRPVGACGLSGTLTETFAAKGTLDVVGYRTVRRRVGSARALADLRAGRLVMSSGGFGPTTVKETVTEAMSAAGSAGCADTASAGLVTGDTGFRHGIDRLQIAPGGPPVAPSADPLRTRCPGPSDAEALDNRALAQGPLAVARLGARRLTVVLGGNGAFTGSGYSGRRSGTLVLTLVLVRARGGTKLIHVPVGLPGGFGVSGGFVS
ncbi:MAG: hypothetical protein ACYCXW_17615, partial [Solirubrobacteraceae bacterium]